MSNRSIDEEKNALLIDRIELSDTISQFMEKVNNNFQKIVQNEGGPAGPKGELGGQGIPTKPKVPIHVWKEGEECNETKISDQEFEITKCYEDLTNVKYQEGHIIMLQNGHVYTLEKDENYNLKPKYILTLQTYTPGEVIDGKKAFVHIAYADDANGSGFITESELSNESYNPEPVATYNLRRNARAGINVLDKQYMGIYTNHTQTPSSDPERYNWIKIQGSDGKDGDVGVSSKIIMIYTSGKHSSGEEFVPDKPIGGSYDFNNNEFVCPDGWFQTDSEIEPPVWMASRTFTSSELSTDKEWSKPVRITGENGMPGEDGASIEYIFRLTYELTQEDLDALSYSPDNENGYVPEPWKGSPTGIDENNTREWCSIRLKNTATKKWGKWEEPTIWSQYGLNGQDGDGVQYIYYLTNTATPPKNPTPNGYTTNNSYQDRNTEWKPGVGSYDNIDGETLTFTEEDNWSDNPKDISVDNQYQWMACRKYRQNKEKKMAWEAFSNPTLWSRFGEKGESGTFIRTMYVTSNGTDDIPDRPTDSTGTGSQWSTEFPTDYIFGENVVWGTTAELKAGSNEFVDETKGWSTPYIVTGTKGVGEQGPKGDKGDKGDTGATGNRGIDGIPGTSFNILYCLGKEEEPFGDKESWNQNPLEITGWFDVLPNPNKIKLIDSNDEKQSEELKKPEYLSENRGRVVYVKDITTDEYTHKHYYINENSQLVDLQENDEDFVSYVWAVQGTDIWSREDDKDIKTGIKWTAPFKLQGTNGIRGVAGADGNRGQVVYPMGVYNSETTYITTDAKAPYVFDNGNYYVLDIIGEWKGSDNGNTTPSQNYNHAIENNIKPTWQKFEGFEAIFTKIGIIANGMVGSAVFNNEFMFSQQGIKKDGSKTDYAIASGEDAGGNSGFLSGYVYDEIGEIDEDGKHTGRHWKYVNTNNYIDDVKVNPYEEKDGTPIHSFRPNVCINFATGQMWLSNGKAIFEQEKTNLTTDVDLSFAIEQSEIKINENIASVSAEAIDVKNSLNNLNDVLNKSLEDGFLSKDEQVRIYSKLSDLNVQFKELYDEHQELKENSYLKTTDDTKEEFKELISETKSALETSFDNLTESHNSYVDEINKLLNISFETPSTYNLRGGLITNTSLLKINLNDHFSQNSGNGWTYKYKTLDTDDNYIDAEWNWEDKIPNDKGEIPGFIDFQIKYEKDLNDYLAQVLATELFIEDLFKIDIENDITAKNQILQGEFEKQLQNLNTTLGKNLADAILDINGNIDELQKQVDGEVSSYFLVGAPVTVEKNNSNVEYDAVNTEVEPLSTWLLNYDKNDDIYTLKVDGKDELFNNLGDTYTNTETYKEDGSKPLAGKSWRWCDATSAINKGEITSDGCIVVKRGEETKYLHWHRITDTDALRALQMASEAQTTADKKCTVYISTENEDDQVPNNYNIGDLWILNENAFKYGKFTKTNNQYVTSDGEPISVGDILNANQASSEYVVTHWSKQVKYTDDTLAKEAKDAADAAKKTADDAQKDAQEGNSKLNAYITDKRVDATEMEFLKSELKEFEEDYKRYISGDDTLGIKPEIDKWEGKIPSNIINYYNMSFDMVCNTIKYYTNLTSDTQDEFEKYGYINILCAGDKFNPDDEKKDYRDWEWISNYYAARQKIANTIADVSKNYSDNIKTTSEIAQQKAQEAQEAADAAKKNADIAKAQLDAIDDDNVISKTEFATLEKQLEDIDFESGKIMSDADLYGVNYEYYYFMRNRAQRAIEFIITDQYDDIIQDMDEYEKYNTCLDEKTGETTVIGVNIFNGDLEYDDDGHVTGGNAFYYDNIFYYYEARQEILYNISAASKTYAESYANDAINNYETDGINLISAVPYMWMNRGPKATIDKDTIFDICFENTDDTQITIKEPIKVSGNIYLKIHNSGENIKYYLWSKNDGVNEDGSYYKKGVVTTKRNPMEMTLSDVLGTYLIDSKDLQYLEGISNFRDKFDKDENWIDIANTNDDSENELKLSWLYKTDEDSGVDTFVFVEELTDVPFGENKELYLACITQFDSNKKYIGDEYLIDWTDDSAITLHENTQYIGVTIKNNSGNAISTDDIKNVKIKIEKGNKCTLYSPAPEDVNVEVLEAQQAVSSLNESLTNTEDLLNKSLEDGFIDNNEKEALKKSLEQIYNDYKSLLLEYGDVMESGYLSEATTTKLGNNMTSLTTWYEDYTYRINEIINIFQETKITVFKPKIRISEIIEDWDFTLNYNTPKTEFYNAISTIRTNLISAQEEIRVAMADEAQLFANAAVSGIVVGGTNLLPNSKPNEKGTWDGNGADVTVENGVLKGIPKSSNKYPRIYNSYFKGKTFELDADYIISFYARADSNRKNGGIYIGGASVNYILNFGSFDVTTEWKRYIFTAKCTLASSSDSTLGLYIYCNQAQSDNTNKWLELKEIKLEKGNKATAWTPAPEDIDAELADTMNAIETLNDDSIFQQSEKLTIRKEWEEISGKAVTPSDTTDVAIPWTYGDNGSYKKTLALIPSGSGISEVEINFALESLQTYLETYKLYRNNKKFLRVGTTDPAVVSDFSRSTLAQYFQAYYNEESNIIKAVNDYFAKKQLQDLQIGGVNLLKGSKRKLWSKYSGSIDATGSYEKDCYKLTYKNEGTYRPYNAITTILTNKKIGGNQITISCKVRSSVAHTRQLGLVVRNSDDSNIINTYANIVEIEANKWTLFTLTYDLAIDLDETNDVANIFFVLWTDDTLQSGTTLEIKENQLELGNKATSWKPNDADTIEARENILKGGMMLSLKKDTPVDLTITESIKAYTEYVFSIEQFVGSSSDITIYDKVSYDTRNLTLSKTLGFVSISKRFVANVNYKISYNGNFNLDNAICSDFSGSAESIIGKLLNDGSGYFTPKSTISVIYIWFDTSLMTSNGITLNNFEIYTGNSSNIATLNVSSNKSNIVFESPYSHPTIKIKSSNDATFYGIKLAEGNKYTPWEGTADEQKTLIMLNNAMNGTTETNGGLMLTNTIGMKGSTDESNTITAGINGLNTNVSGMESDLRFWAGSNTWEDIQTAPFRVYDNGKVYATNFYGFQSATVINKSNYSKYLTDSEIDLSKTGSIIYLDGDLIDAGFSISLAFPKPLEEYIGATITIINPHRVRINKCGSILDPTFINESNAFEPYKFDTLPNLRPSVPTTYKLGSETYVIVNDAFGSFIKTNNWYSKPSSLIGGGIIDTTTTTTTPRFTYYSFTYGGNYTNPGTQVCSMDASAKTGWISSYTIQVYKLIASPYMYAPNGFNNSGIKQYKKCPIISISGYDNYYSYLMWVLSEERNWLKNLDE